MMRNKYKSQKYTQELVQSNSANIYTYFSLNTCIETGRKRKVNIYDLKNFAYEKIVIKREGWVWLSIRTNVNYNFRGKCHPGLFCDF